MLKCKWPSPQGDDRVKFADQRGTCESNRYGGVYRAGQNRLLLLPRTIEVLADSNFYFLPMARTVLLLGVLTEIAIADTRGHMR